jgi:hypothetical protein
VPPLVYRTLNVETLTDFFVEYVKPPPARGERWSDYGLPQETAVDVYMDTKVRTLGLWVDDLGHKLFAMRPRRFPKGLAPWQRQQLLDDGIVLAAPGWILTPSMSVLNVETARCEARRLAALAPTTDVEDGVFDPCGRLAVACKPPRAPRKPRGRRPIAAQ